MSHVIIWPFKHFSMHIMHIYIFWKLVYKRYIMMTYHLNMDFDFDRIRNIWKSFMLVFKIITQSSSIIQRLRKSIHFIFLNTALRNVLLYDLVGVSLSILMLNADNGRYCILNTNRSPKLRWKCLMNSDFNFEYFICHDLCHNYRSTGYIWRVFF